MEVNWDHYVRTNAAPDRLPMPGRRCYTCRQGDSSDLEGKHVSILILPKVHVLTLADFVLPPEHLLRRLSSPHRFGVSKKAYGLQLGQCPVPIAVGSALIIYFPHNVNKPNSVNTNKHALGFCSCHMDANINPESAHPVHPVAVASPFSICSDLRWVMRSGDWEMRLASSRQLVDSTAAG
ncbi:GD14395 [Drosophila simulans]|uniref:GD14395 n=1 Tax=Drosophila simulans TaxID=7240 RepID=B4QRQ2_DROSI|nr:GD14395 [Drosophila simulans]